VFCSSQCRLCANTDSVTCYSVDSHFCAMVLCDSFCDMDHKSTIKSIIIIIVLLPGFFKENVRYLVWTCRDPMIISSDSRDLIFNSRDLN